MTILNGLPQIHHMTSMQKTGLPSPREMIIITYLYGLKNIYPFISVLTTKNLKLFDQKVEVIANNC